MAQASVSDVTALVKTFERPKCLDTLIRSIRRFYPEMRIMVADDSFRPTPRSDVNYHILPPDTGLSAGRNHLLERIETPYFLLLDDDWELTSESDVPRLLSIVQNGDVCLAAGDLIRCTRKMLAFVRRRPQPYHGVFREEGRHLTVEPGWKVQADGYFTCDIVNNFFVAETETVRGIGGWEKDCKTNEQIEFFYRLRQHGLGSAYCPDVKLWNWNIQPRFYRRFRRRSHLHVCAAKHGFDKITDFDRTVNFRREVA